MPQHPVTGDKAELTDWLAMGMVAHSSEEDHLLNTQFRVMMSNFFPSDESPFKVCLAGQHFIITVWLEGLSYR